MKKIITAAALALLCAACSSTTDNAESIQVADARQIHVGSRSDTHAETNARGWVDMSPEGIAKRKAGK